VLDASAAKQTCAWRPALSGIRYEHCVSWLMAFSGGGRGSDGWGGGGGGWPAQQHEPPAEDDDYGSSSGRMDRGVQGTAEDLAAVLRRIEGAGYKVNWRDEQGRV
jgi:hypothetical protein